MTTTPAVDAALRGDRFLIFGAFAIDLPGYALRMLDGSAEIPIGGEIYKGYDARFGMLGAFKIGDDGAGDEAPTLQLTFYPASDAAVATLASANMQNSDVTFSIGLLDRETGLPIPDLVPWFGGELNVPRLSFGKGTVIEYNCVSGISAFQSSDEGIRLSDAHHQSVWPGELGASNVTGILSTSNWGNNPVSS